jgi:hypothetical protein
MARIHRLDTAMDLDVDGEQTRDGAAFPLDAKRWLRHLELRVQARMMYIEQRRNRQIMKQPRPGSLAANGKVARMMAAMGYMPGRQETDPEARPQHQRLRHI